MKGDFQEEIETKETLLELHRKILTIESQSAEKAELMVTFRPDFQMKLEIYGGTPIYQQDHSRTIFLHPWFSDMSQEEPYKVWKLQ